MSEEENIEISPLEARIDRLEDVACHTTIIIDKIDKIIGTMTQQLEIVCTTLINIQKQINEYNKTPNYVT